MMNEDRAEDETVPEADKSGSDMESQVGSSAPQPADEVSKSAWPKEPETAIREKAKAGSTPGSEYWLP